MLSDMDINVKKKYDTILFDLDGTLTDSSSGIINSIKYALTELGREFSDKEIFQKFLGPPLIYSFRNFCGFDDELANQAVNLYRQRYDKYCDVENALYDGICDTLERLCSAGKRLIVATSKPDIYAKRIVSHFGLDRYFYAVCGATLDESRNTKTLVIKYALESCNVTDLEHTLMVGDRKHDIEGAAACGIDSMGVLYGYGDLTELKTAGADYIAATVSDIADIILL